MRKITKRIFFGLVILVVSFLLFLLVVPYFFSGQVKGMIEKQVNRQITAEMKIGGDADISLLSHFPNASISFYDILIIDSTSSVDTVLQTDRLSFLFNPFDLINGQYRVEKISLGNAFLNLYTDKDGANYNILRESETDTIQVEENDLSLNIKELTFSSIRVKYLNDEQAQNMEFTVSNGLVSVGYDESLADVLLSADLLPGKLQIGNAVYNLPESIGISGGINIDEENAVYRLSNSRFLVEGDVYELEGLFEEKPYGLWIDIMAKGHKVGLGSLWALASQSGVGKDWELESDGDLNFSTTVKGPFGSGRIPKIEALLDLKNGTISSNALEDDMESVELSAFYSNGEKQNLSSTVIDLKRWSGVLNGDPFLIEGTVENLERPAIRAKVDGAFDGKTVSGLLEEFGFEKVRGKLYCEGLKVNIRPDWKADVNGKLSLEEISLMWNDQPFSAASGKLDFQNRNVAIDIDRWQAGASDFTLSGQVSQWPGLFLAENNTHPMVKIDISGTYHDWGELMEIFVVSSEDSVSHTTKPDYLSFLRQIRGDVNYSCQKFAAGTFFADDVLIMGTLRPYLLTIDSVGMATSSGLLSLNATGRYLNDELILENHLKGSGINIHDLFTSFDNFWQDYLVDDNLEGTVEGTVDGILVFDNSLEVKIDDIDLKGNLMVTDGELRDFEPLNQLSGFVKVKELEDIKFSTLKNIVLIKGDRVALPVMSIKSTAMNLWLSGEYFYDETIDYQFKIDLMDVLARKMSLGSTSLRDAEQKEEGLVNLYVSMTGDIDNPNIEMNKRRVKERFYEMNLARSDDFIDYSEIDEQRHRHTFNPRKSDDDDDLEFIEDW